MRSILAFALFLALLFLCYGLAGATNYRKSGITAAVIANGQIESPNKYIFGPPMRTAGVVYACQDSFFIPVGSTYHFVPWQKAPSGAYRIFPAWIWEVFPTNGCVRVTCYQHRRAISDTLTWRSVSPDSSMKWIKEGVQADSVVLRALVACSGRIGGR